MRTKRIELQGEAQDGRYATLTRDPGSDYITVVLIAADGDGITHNVDADCEEDMRSMARCLQERLDGFRGTNSMAYEYLCELQRFGS